MDSKDIMEDIDESYERESLNVIQEVSGEDASKEGSTPQVPPKTYKDNSTRHIYKQIKEDVQYEIVKPEILAGSNLHDDIPLYLAPTLSTKDDPFDIQRPEARYVHYTDQLEYIVANTNSSSNTGLNNVKKHRKCRVSRKCCCVILSAAIGLVIGIAIVIGIVFMLHHPNTGCRIHSAGTWISSGHRINQTFSNVFNKVKVRDQIHVMYQFTGRPIRMSAVNNRLWVSFHYNHTIQVLDPYVPHNISVISHPQLKNPEEIRQIHCNVLVSSLSGLHVLDVQGAYLYNISSGKFYGLYTRGDVAYAYKHYNDTAGYIVTLEYSSGRWGVKDTFPVRGGLRTTIALVSDTLYVCSLDSHTIYTYSLTGRNIKQYGSQGSKSLGRLFYPFLRGVDSQGSLLICDFVNVRLQVLSPDGTWQVVDLGVTDPKDVVIDVSGTVWVLSLVTVWKGDVEYSSANITRLSV